MSGSLLDLNGRWSVAACPVPPADGAMPDAGSLDWIDATVPRAVHYDLMEAGRLENIYAGSKASGDAHWVAETDWVYRRDFDLPEELLGAARRLLRLESVDTFADVFVNGVFVGSTANMFTPYAFDLAEANLEPSGNTIVVHVKAHARMVAGKAPEALRRISVGRGDEFTVVRSLVRRYQRNFADNMIGMGHAVIGIGIPRAVSIIGLPAAFVEDAWSRVESLDAREAVLAVRAVVDARLWAGGPLTCRAELRAPGGGAVVCSAEAPVAADGGCLLRLRVAEPRLWWPAGYGSPERYGLTVTLTSGGERVHAVERAIGIRTVELVRELPNGRKSFFFRINGTKVYARGANLIPIDYLNGCGTRAQNDDRLRMASAAHMNMLRLWGGGTLEPESFLDECDRLGIMVWKDFHMHSHTYPDYDEEWVAEVRRESIEVVKVLRRHPCFTVVCGANETQEGWDHWNWRVMVDRFYGERLIYDVLAKVAAEECPDVPYVPSSPHGEGLAQSPVDGDTHTWGNFLNATKDPQFITETCWFSGAYSRAETIESCMGISLDEFAGLRWHERWRELTSISLERNKQYSEYHPLGSLRQYIRGLEIELMRADYTALSLLRCRSSSCNGILYWPLNKGGPFFNFGCIDYLGRPLMSYYALKRLFADVVVNVYRDIDDIRVVAANAGAEIRGARLTVARVNGRGETLEEMEVKVDVPQGNSVRLHELPGAYDRVGDRWTEAVQARLEAGGEVLSEDTLFFCALSEFRAEGPRLEAEARRSGERRWELEIACDGFSKMTAVESGARLLLSDNYFAQRPGTRRLTVAALDPVPAGGIVIRVESLDGPAARELRLG